MLLMHVPNVCSFSYFTIYGLPDPTAALEAYSAAGGCPLSVLLEHFTEPFDPFTFIQ